MKKSTPFKADFNAFTTNGEKTEDQKKLATSPKEQTIKNILAFSKAYSVRNSSSMDKMEFILN